MWKKIRFFIVNWVLTCDEKHAIVAGLDHLDFHILHDGVLDAYEHMDFTREEVKGISSNLWY